MVKKSRGYRSRTRKLLSKKPREKGMAPLGKMLRTYSIGEKVRIMIDPSVAKAQPHKRFHGKVAEVIGFRGKALVLKLKDGNKFKTIITTKDHILPIKRDT